MEAKGEVADEEICLLDNKTEVTRRMRRNRCMRRVRESLISLIEEIVQASENNNNNKTAVAACQPKLTQFLAEKEGRRLRMEDSRPAV